MKRINFEAPVMELIALGAEDIICTSEQSEPHFVKATAAPSAGKKEFAGVNFGYTGD